MDYHHSNQHTMQHQNYYGQSSGGLNLPDASQSSEKALMWGQTNYMSESGYSTQAPSISSIDAFLNNEQMDSTMHNMDNESSISSATGMNQIQTDWNTGPKTSPQPVAQPPQAPAPVEMPPRQQPQLQSMITTTQSPTGSTTKITVKWPSKPFLTSSNF